MNLTKHVFISFFSTFHFNIYAQASKLEHNLQMSQQQFNNNDNDNAINYDHHEDYNLYGQSSQSSHQHGENPVDLVLHRKDKKVKKDCFVWKDDLVYYMIELWKNEPILYNAKHADYFDKNKRNLALGRMWDQLSLCVSSTHYRPKNRH